MRIDPARKGVARILPANGLRGRRAVPGMRQGPPALRSPRRFPAAAGERRTGEAGPGTWLGRGWLGEGVEGRWPGRARALTRCPGRPPCRAPRLPADLDGGRRLGGGA